MIAAGPRISMLLAAGAAMAATVAAMEHPIYVPPTEEEIEARRAARRAAWAAEERAKLERDRPIIEAAQAKRDRKNARRLELAARRGAA